MNVDIDDLYEKHFAWKRCLQEKDDAIHLLNEQLKTVKEENDALKSIVENLFQGMASVNEVLLELRDDVQKYKDYEPKMMLLLEDKKRLIKHIEDLQKKHQEEVLEINSRAAAVERDHEVKIKKMKSDLTNQKNEVVAAMLEEAEKSKETILGLKQNIENHESERKMLLHLKTEYEKQILKTKVQELSVKQSTRVSSITDEIFRKKYENLEKVEAEKNKEIKILQERIEELKRHNKRLIETNHSKIQPRSSNILRKPAESEEDFSFPSSLSSNHRSQVKTSASHSLPVQYSKPAVEVMKPLSGVTKPTSGVTKPTSGVTKPFVKAQDAAGTKNNIPDNSKPSTSGFSAVNEQIVLQKALVNKENKTQSAVQIKKRKLFNSKDNFLC